MSWRLSGPAFTRATKRSSWAVYWPRRSGERLEIRKSPRSADDRLRNGDRDRRGLLDLDRVRGRRDAGHRDRERLTGRLGRGARAAATATTGCLPHCDEKRGGKPRIARAEVALEAGQREEQENRSDE